jgi:hypothetical protein
MTYEITKKMTKGLLKGNVVVESMSFVDDYRAFSWADKINVAGTADYRITNINNVSTGDNIFGEA